MATKEFVQYQKKKIYYQIEMIILIEGHAYNLNLKKKCEKMLKYLNKNNFKLIHGSFPGNGIFKNKRFNYND